MRFGIDARLLFYQRGGISQYIFHLIQALGELDQENQYLLFASQRDNNDYRPQSTSNFYQLQVWTPCHNRLEKWSLGIELSLHNLKVLHSPDFIPPSFGAKRRLITVHDLNFLLFPKFVSPESHRYYTRQISWAVKVADHISADSNHTRLDLIERLKVPPEKITTIHLAANPLYSIPRPKTAIESTLKKNNLPHGYLLFVGALIPRKNIETLILAYHQLLHEYQENIPLVIVGDPGWRSEKVALTIADLNLEKHVRILNDVSDNELANLYSAAGVFALPSYYEGFGLPPLEAMHCGCPVIVSNRGSLPEVVGDAGIILEPDDVDKWTESLMAVLSKQEMREKLIAAGNEQVKKFTWHKTAESTLKLYNLLADSG